MGESPVACPPAASYLIGYEYIPGAHTGQFGQLLIKSHFGVAAGTMQGNGPRKFMGRSACPGKIEE
jgi:hypothetical protein